jgi:uncharacterized ion transporter superfamily protein YfcC
MKNKNLWLSFLIFVGFIFLLSWLIPATNYDSAGALTSGAISPTGIWDIFYYISMLPLWFGQNFVYVIIIAIFYGVISKTGALRALEEKVGDYFKKRERIFLIVSSSLFIILSSLTGINIALLIFIPLFMGIILSLGFNKITALMATIVPILVGTMGSLYSTFLYTALSGYVKEGISYGWYKFALIIAGLLIVNLYLFFTAKTGKGKDKEQIDEEMLFIEKIDGQKKTKIWPLITAFSVMLVLFILGLTPWASMYNFNGFADFNTKLLDIKIGSFAIFKSFLGTTTAAFGSWNISDAAALILLITLVLILIYRIKWAEVFKGAVDGIMRMLPVAVFVLVSNIAFIIVSQSGILNTIVKFFAYMTDGINVFTYSISSFIGAALVNETYITSNVTWILNTVLGEGSNLTLLILIQQVMYGLAMMVAPTSVILLAGLSYLNVDYTKWIKKSWLLTVMLAAVSIIILTIAVAL